LAAAGTDGRAAAAAEWVGAVRVGTGDTTITIGCARRSASPLTLAGPGAAPGAPHYADGDLVAWTCSTHLYLDLLDPPGKNEEKRVNCEYFLLF